MKTVTFNFTKEQRTSVLGQAKFEETELLRCHYVNQLGFHDIYIHASTFALIYYEECQSPVQPCPEKCVKNISRPNQQCLEMSTQSTAQTLQRDDFLPTFIKP
jgi:hypothetical protein